MRFAAAFMQETKETDLSMRRQQMLLERAAEKLGWCLCTEMVAQAGTEKMSLCLRPGMQELLEDARTHAYDILLVLDAEHLFCSKDELQFVIAALGREDIHIFGVRDGFWIETRGRHWMMLPGFEMVGAGYEVDEYA